MTIIKIAPDSNGAHANQTVNGTLETIPDGWAAVPEPMTNDVMSWLPWVIFTAEDGTVTSAEQDTVSKDIWDAEHPAEEEEEA